jgi:hypothetical protein
MGHTYNDSLDIFLPSVSVFFRTHLITITLQIFSLSPIQPTWVPPNLIFEVDDAESPWLYNPNNPFDFIHMRDLGGSISDWPRLVQQSYEHIKPGGWIEIQEFEFTLKSDDDSMRLAPNLVEYIKKIHEASKIFKKPMNIAESHKQRLLDMGFEDVRDDVFKV